MSQEQRNETSGCHKCRHLVKSTDTRDPVICQRTEWVGEGDPQYNRNGWKIGNGWSVITRSLKGIDWMKDRPSWCLGKEI
jgi:hypothetical protein